MFNIMFLSIWIIRFLFKLVYYFIRSYLKSWKYIKVLLSN